MHLFLVAMSIVTKLILIKDVGGFSLVVLRVFIKTTVQNQEQFILEM